MDPMQIYVKTPLGSEEIKNRKLHLAPRLRAMLIMVDGRKSVAALKKTQRNSASLVILLKAYWQPD